MGIFGDKPKQLPKTSEDKKQQGVVSPQMVESLKIQHWELGYDSGPAKEKKEGFLSRMLKPPQQLGWILNVNVTANVALKGNLTASGIEVGFFLNYNLLGTASCDEWGKVSFTGALPKAFKTGDTLTAQIKGTAIEEEVVLTPPKYICSDNGTVLDTQTYLMWMRCALGQTWNGTTCVGKASEMKWQKACQQKSSFAGYKDWRIPTAKELRTLVDTSQFAAKINSQAFPNCPAAIFWSGSPYANNSDGGCNFGDGDFGNFGEYRSNGNVRLVRGGQ